MMRRSNISKLLIVSYVAILAVVGCGCTAAKDSNHVAPVIAPSSADPKESAAATADNLSQSSVDSLDSYVSEAIISYNKDKYMGGEDQQFVTEYHDTIKTVEQDDKATVYAVALYAQYKQTNNEPELTGAGCGPVALTFQKKADETYALTEYWEAPDNSDEKSLQEKFPRMRQKRLIRF